MVDFWFGNVRDWLTLTTVLSKFPPDFHILIKLLLPILINILVSKDHVTL